MVMKSSHNTMQVYIQGVLESMKQRRCKRVNHKCLDTHKKHRDTNIYYKYVPEQKSNCKPLQDISTQDTMKVHLLRNTGVTGSRKQCFIIGLFTVPFQIFIYIP